MKDNRFFGRQGHPYNPSAMTVQFANFYFQRFLKEILFCVEYLENRLNNRAHCSTCQN